MPRSWQCLTTFSASCATSARLCSLNTKCSCVGVAGARGGVGATASAAQAAPSSIQPCWPHTQQPQQPRQHPGSIRRGQCGPGPAGTPQAPHLVHELLQVAARAQLRHDAHAGRVLEAVKQRDDGGRALQPLQNVHLPRQLLQRLLQRQLAAHFGQHLDGHLAALRGSPAGTESQCCAALSAPFKSAARRPSGPPALGGVARHALQAGPRRQPATHRVQVDANVHLTEGALADLAGLDVVAVEVVWGRGARRGCQQRGREGGPACRHANAAEAAHPASPARRPRTPPRRSTG